MPTERRSLWWLLIFAITPCIDRVRRLSVDRRSLSNPPPWTPLDVDSAAVSCGRHTNALSTLNAVDLTLMTANNSRLIGDKFRLDQLLLRTTRCRLMSNICAPLDYGTIHAVPLMAAVERFVHRVGRRLGEGSECHECCFIGWFL